MRSTPMLGMIAAFCLLPGARSDASPGARSDASPGARAQVSLPAEPAAPAAQTEAGSEADPLSLEELMNVQVSTVSRVDERIDESPGSVYVFPRSVIQERGYRSLGELLRVVPGFTVLHRDLQFVAGVRGLNANDNEKITLLINGQELNQVNEPDFLNGPINLESVERVEVVVGPSSLFQRANTLAATINVITRDAEDAEAIVSVGGDLRNAATLMAGRRPSPDRFFSVALTTESKRGFDAWDARFRRNLAGRNETGRLEQPSFFGVVKGQRGGWSGQIVAYRTTFPELLINNGDNNISPSPNDAEYVDQFYSLFVQNERQWTPTLEGVLRLDATYKQSARRNRNGPPILSLDPLSTSLEQNIAQRDYTAELGVRYTGLDRHLIQAGVQGAFEDNFDSFYTLNLEKRTLIDRDTHALGFYIDDEFQANDRLKLIVGARVDRNTILPGSRWFVGGRSALVYRARPTWVTKLIYNRAVRMPSPLAALNAAWGLGKPGAPDFADDSPNARDPETLSTVEFQNIVYLGRARLGATIYHQKLQDFISWFQPHTNVGDFSGNGLEVSLQVPLPPHLTLWANASLNDSELTPFAQYRPPVGAPIEQHHVIINDQGRIIGAAEWTANLGLDYRVGERLTISPTLRYFTEQAAFDNTDSAFETIRNRAYLDLGLMWRNAGGPDRDVRLTAYNLLNNRSPIAGQWLRDVYRPRGREIALSLGLRF